MPDETLIDVKPIEPVADDVELTAPPADQPEPEPEPEPIIDVVLPAPMPTPAPTAEFKIVAGVNFSIGAGGSITKV